MKAPIGQPAIPADAVDDEADAAVEAILWAERFAAAEAWEPVGDADGRDPGEPDLSPAAQRWVAGGFHREELLFEWERASEQIARWQAIQVRILAESLDLATADATGSEADLSVRSLAAELACAVGLSDRTVQQHMNDAAVMRDRFTDTLAALRAGRMSRAHAQVIVDEGWRLDDEAARAEYQRLVLERGAGLTTGRLRALAKAIAESFMPISITERHVEARAQRRVWVRDVEDGMSDFWMHGPAPLVHGMYDRVTQLARTVQQAAAEDAVDDRDAASSEDVEPTGADEVAAAPTDDRTLDQIRADVLADLVLTGHATAAGTDRDGGEGIDAIRGIVQIVVPVQVLTGEADAGSATGAADETDAGNTAVADAAADHAPRARPFAMLAGGCPIDAESARRIAGGATVWDRIWTDPVTGHLVDVDRRFPTEAQNRLLRARDEHCRFPGCRMPVWRTDVDHTLDHQHGGKTEPCNLAHLCRRHHMLKHHSAWRVEQLPGGVLVWTSPLGRTYADTPPAVLRFVPTRPDPPS